MRLLVLIVALAAVNLAVIARVVRPKPFDIGGVGMSGADYTFMSDGSILIYEYSPSGVRGPPYLSRPATRRSPFPSTAARYRAWGAVIVTGTLSMLVLGVALTRTGKARGAT